MMENREFRGAPTLENLLPTPNGMIALKDAGDYSALHQLFRDRDKSVNWLKDYKRNRMRKSDILPLLRLAVRCEPSSLESWIEFHKWYQHPSVDLDDDNDRREMVRLEKDITRNSAVYLYRKSKVLAGRGKLIESQRSLTGAQIQFDRFMHNFDGFIQLTPGQADTLREKVDESQSPVPLFFDESLVRAREELLEVGEAMLDKNFKIVGIDEGLIRAFLAGVHFPFVHKEYDKMEAYILRKNGVNQEEFNRYRSLMVDEFFSDPKAPDIDTPDLIDF